MPISPKLSDCELVHGDWIGPYLYVDTDAGGSRVQCYPLFSVIMALGNPRFGQLSEIGIAAYQCKVYRGCFE
jgi:hypothetical protein